MLVDAVELGWLGGDEKGFVISFEDLITAKIRLLEQRGTS